MKSNENVKDKLNVQGIRLKHMFQSQGEDGVGEEYVSDTLNAENMNKIVFKFKNKQGDKMVLVNSVKSMITLSNNQTTMSLLDHIGDLKASFSNAQNLPNLETDFLEDMAQPVEEVNFDEIISKSEEVLYREKDKKSLLYHLINDINQSSKNQTRYNDEQFEHNIESILNSVDDDDDVRPTVDLKSIAKPVVKKDVTEMDSLDQIKVPKKGKKRIFFILFIIMGLSAVFYLYQDDIINLFSNLLDKWV